MDIFSIDSREEYIKLKDMVDINKKNEERKNAFEVAVLSNDIKKCFWLLEEGISLSDLSFFEDQNKEQIYVNFYSFYSKLKPYELLQEKFIENEKILDLLDDFNKNSSLNKKLSFLGKTNSIKVFKKLHEKILLFRFMKVKIFLIL